MRRREKTECFQFSEDADCWQKDGSSGSAFIDCPKDFSRVRRRRSVVVPRRQSLPILQEDGPRPRARQIRRVSILMPSSCATSRGRRSRSIGLLGLDNINDKGSVVHLVQTECFFQSTSATNRVCNLPARLWIEAEFRTYWG